MSLLAISADSFAHAPVVELKDSSTNQPIVISWSLETSVAIYAHFENESDVDVIRFSVGTDQAEKGQPLYLHTLVPACSAYRELLPTLAVVGPIQEAIPVSGTGSQLPFSMKPDQGVALLQNKRQGDTWFEPYSKKNYFWQRSLRLNLSQPGEYTVYAWSADKKIGDYVLAVGTRERWGLREIGRAARHMPRLLSNREIHNKECRQELKRQTPSPNPLPADAHSG